MAAQTQGSESWTSIIIWTVSMLVIVAAIAIYMGMAQ